MLDKWKNMSIMINVNTEHTFARTKHEQKRKGNKKMKPFEIKVYASYITDGGTKEWNAFKEYVTAKNENEAKKTLRAKLKADGYHNITLDDVIEVK